MEIKSVKWYNFRPYYYIMASHVLYCSIQHFTSYWLKCYNIVFLMYYVSLYRLSLILHATLLTFYGSAEFSCFNTINKIHFLSCVESESKLWRIVMSIKVNTDFCKQIERFAQFIKTKQSGLLIYLITTAIELQISIQPFERMTSEKP